MMNNEAFSKNADHSHPLASKEADGVRSTGRDYFTPLWRTKGAQSFAGRRIKHYSKDNGTIGGGNGLVPASMAVESEGFVPLVKVGNDLRGEEQEVQEGMNGARIKGRREGEREIKIVNEAVPFLPGLVGKTKKMEDEKETEDVKQTQSRVHIQNWFRIAHRDIR